MSERYTLEQFERDKASERKRPVRSPSSSKRGSQGEPEKAVD
jgi:hypothetical protein